MRASPDESPIRAIVLDIEGTTTPVDFVYKVLFPYARERAAEFLRLHWSDPEVSDDVSGLRVEHQADSAGNLGPPKWAADGPAGDALGAARYVQWLIDRDRKCSPLKSLEGKIWREGYAKGELHGQVFPDVLPALIRWEEQGKRISIFSSGSVLAQKLLFSTTTGGDLTRFIEAHFDTSVGPKDVAESYRRIAESLALRPQAILFISDVVRELDAAQSTGWQTALCVRGETPPEAAGTRHPVVRSFERVCPRRAS